MDPTIHSRDELGDTDPTPVQTDEERNVSERFSLRGGAVPGVVGGYEILQCLGEGSFGTVWLARERKTGRQVAIKFFTNRRGLDWSLLTREVEKLAVLDASRDVVRLLDVGVDHDPPYFVMEYLPHRSVATLLENGPLPVSQAIEMIRCVARALVHAHSAGILHCDIKPGNVLLDRGNEARLADFGQSRLATDQTSSLGTFYYMAPEQALRNAVPDVRWDVYALGALLYHMLTGRPPYRTEEAEKQLQEAGTLDARLAAYRDLISTSPFPSDHRGVPGVDTELAELIDGCLHRDPARRTPNAQVVLDTLDRRELNEARRPLVWLGFLGPVLFLLALVWIASRAVPDMVNHAEKHLVESYLASDAATVRLLASSISQELLDRQSELERLARRLTPRENGGEFMGFRADYNDVLDQWRSDTDERLEKQGRTLDESLFLTDRNGLQLYRSPWSTSIGYSFAYRDYFHGLGRELSPLTDDVSSIRPRTEPGVSMAFRSSNTGRFMVAIAVPVWDSEERKEVIGVLARTIHLTDLLDQWERRISDPDATEDGEGTPPRILSLVDMRENPPMLLDHEWLSEGVASRYTEGDLRQILRLTRAEAEMLRAAARTGEGIHSYQDPLADQDEHFRDAWLAAVAQTADINWIAVVQERRSDAVAPMSELYVPILRWGLVTLLVFATMLISLWWLIQRAVAR